MAFVFLACAVVISMAAMQPVFVAVSFAGSVSCSAACRGLRATARSFAWIVPLVLVVTVANPLFSGSGITELMRIGPRAIYAESLVYGACSGGMLASVFLWFASYSSCMNSANSLALFGNVLPVVSLMVSQVMRLVPQFVSRGRSIAAAQGATSAAAARSKGQQAKGRFRIVSVLMGWGMEDGIERSDTMRARGYDCGVRRTTYTRYRFGRSDAAIMALVVALAATSGVSAVGACASFSFYPTLSGWVAWWSYVPYVALMALPPALRLKEWLLWR